MYPASEIDPQKTETKTSNKTTSNSFSLKSFLKTRSGRLVAAAFVGVFFVVLAIARKQEPNPTETPIKDITATDEQLFATNNLMAGEIPQGGFQFQNLGLGNVATDQPLQTTASASLPEVQIVTVPEIQIVEVPIVEPSAPVTPAPVIQTTSVKPVTKLPANTTVGIVSKGTPKPVNPNPKGYYRASRGAVIYFEDGAGRRTNAGLSAAQMTAIAGVEKKAATGAGQTFTINNITHVMDARDKGFIPKAAAGRVIN